MKNNGSSRSRPSSSDEADAAAGGRGRGGESEEVAGAVGRTSRQQFSEHVGVSKNKKRPTSLSSSAVRDDDDFVATTATNKKQKKQEEKVTETMPTKSRRQRMKEEKLKSKNVIPMPHPRMQSAEARAKQHVRTAGFVVRQQKSPTEQSKFDPNSPEIKFGRLLGSADHRVRHGAVMHLRAYLKARCGNDNNNNLENVVGLSELDLLKLWKAVWYTLYMADQVSVQDELSKHLSQLIWCVVGTQEEDEYAAQVYLDMSSSAPPISSNTSGTYFDDDEEQERDDDDCGGRHRAEAENSSDDDDEDVTMEEIVNTLEDGVDASSSDDDEDSSSSSSDDASTSSGFDDEDEEEDYSTVPHCRGAHLASLMVATFFETVLREWGKMDKYRLDKFYTLIRLMLRETLKYVAQRFWNLGIIGLINDALYEHVLSQTPNGLRFHLIDIVLEELAGVEADAPMHLTEATFIDLMEPYFALMQNGGGGDSTGDDLVQQRVIDKVFIPLLDEFSVYSSSATVADESDNDEHDEQRGDRKLIFRQVHIGTIAKFIFEIASDAETPDRYRKSLYNLHKYYRRRINELGEEHDVELIHHDDGNDEGFEVYLREDDFEEENDGDVQGLPDEPPSALDGDGSSAHSSSENGPVAGRAPRKKDSTTFSDVVDLEEKGTGKADKVQRDSETTMDLSQSKTPKVSKKKRKKSSGRKKATEPHHESVVAGHEISPAPSEKRKKKNNQKDSTSNKSRELPSSKQDSVADEEITITIQEQTDARKALTKERKKQRNAENSAGAPSAEIHTKNKKRKKQESDEAERTPDDKRVKFGAAIKARSYKASMKGLRTKDPPTPSEATPEHGILRNKNTEIKKVKRNMRRRATDYF